MKLTDIMSHPLNEIVGQMDVTKITPIAHESGEVIKIIVEYTPSEVIAENGYKSGKIWK